MIYNIDASKIRGMSDTNLRWMIDLATDGLKGAWKNDKLAPQVKKALELLKAEHKARKAKKR